jgi:hypothetical protein
VAVTTPVKYPSPTTYNFEVGFVLPSPTLLSRLILIASSPFAPKPSCIFPAARIFETKS